MSLGTVSYSSPAATGTLPYIISSTRGGTATVRVAASNGQAQNGSIARSFRVTVPTAPVVSGTRGATGGEPVAVYPNPAPSGRFELAGAAPGPLSVTVLDLSGRIVVVRELVAGPHGAASHGAAGRVRSARTHG